MDSFYYAFMACLYYRSVFKDWDSVLNTVRHLIWIAFIYSILIIISPEVTKASYITVASNLIYVVLLATYSSVKQGKWFSLMLCVVCWLPMLLYGSRTMLFGILGVFFSCLFYCL